MLSLSVFRNVDAENWGSREKCKTVVDKLSPLNIFYLNTWLPVF